MLFNDLFACFSGQHGFYLSMSYVLFVALLTGFAARTWWTGRRLRLSLTALNKEN